ncbi:hypothetical protein AJ80_05766 [Polytolypa hystricis UAMH7299]|uniref:Uncharacterized protein n=1 Tax=Polytolypa hystricis (strain UAMH7299) TaxID=1447883 RepID=A0A2B7Y0M9_POLH7|nr:hypothetical protein AJ80_05766 [Polytolypa hystricis UAMH7299]
MGSLSSKSYIKLHALFQFLLAIYLTNSREVITGSDELVYQADNGMRIKTIPTFNRPRSPFAYCGIVLIILALFDLILVVKLPRLNQIMVISLMLQSEADPASAQANSAANKAASVIKTLFTQICILLAVARFCAFSIISLRIYASSPESWTSAVGLHYDGSIIKDARLEDMKHKVVLAYGVMEMMFSSWVRI